MRVVVAPLVIAALAGTATAHIALTSPARRGQEQKQGPCGLTGSTRGATTTTFEPGETITVEWDETVDHSGHYRIAFDADGDDDFPNPRQPDDAYPSTLVDQIADHAAGHYTQDITLPDVECTNCTLQLMQIMSDVVPYNSFYYQCADVTLTRSTGGDDTGDDTGGASGGCSAGRGNAAGAGLVVLALAVALGGRRSRRRA